MKSFIAFSALATMLVASAGCDRVDAAFDCHAICSRYRDCLQSNYDVDACENRCRSHSETDTEFRRNANECDACINERACVSATFNCASECSDIVP